MRALRLVGLFVSLALAAGPGASLAEGPAPAGYRIIVHADSAVTTLDRRFLEDAFLKKVKTWPGGQLIRSVDLGVNSQVRRRFSEEVLRRPVAAVSAYWQQRIFSGRDLPPPAFDGEEDVINYVSSHAGAIGYVSASAPLKAVKGVAITF